MCDEVTTKMRRSPLCVRYGLILLMGYLGADGFTSMFQEKLFADHKTSKSAPPSDPTKG